MNTSESQRHLPWVGPGYQQENPFGCRLWVIGESQYSDNTDREDFTLELIRMYQSGEMNSRFYTGILRALTGLENHDLNREDLFNQFAFSNYVQGLAGDGPRQNPSEQQLLQAQEVFYEDLEKLQPDAILVVSRRLWSWLPRLGSFPEESDDWWHYSLRNGKHEAIATFINHPSGQGFCPKQWSPRVQALLRRGKEKAAINRTYQELFQTP